MDGAAKKMSFRAEPQAESRNLWVGKPRASRPVRAGGHLVLSGWSVDLL